MSMHDERGSSCVIRPEGRLLVLEIRAWQRLKAPIREITL